MDGHFLHFEDVPKGYANASSYEEDGDCDKGTHALAPSLLLALLLKPVSPMSGQYGNARSQMSVSSQRRNATTNLSFSLSQDLVLPLLLVALVGSISDSSF